MAKLNFQKPLHQFSVSHDPSQLTVLVDNGYLNGYWILFLPILRLIKANLLR